MKNRMLLKGPQSERGAILILTALLVVTLITFVALAVDLSMKYDHATEQATVASSGALAANEAYGLMASSATYSQKINRAKTRAREIVGLALNRKLGDKFLEPVQGGGGALSQAIICFENDSAPDCTNPNNINGRIIPGKYHWSEPGGTGGCSSYIPDLAGQHCPCSDDTGGGVWSGPCFEKNNPDVAGHPNQSASAFQITLGTQASAPVMNVFGRALSLNTPIAPAQGTATAVPRKIQFLVDTSNSTVRDNHIVNGTHGSEAAFSFNDVANPPGSATTCVEGQRVTAANVCSTADVLVPQVAQDCSLFPEFKWYRNSSGLETLFPPQAAQPAMQQLRASYNPNDYNPPGPAIGSSSFAEWHFKDDFYCRIRSYQECAGCTDDDINNCANCTTKTEHYLVDEYRKFTSGGAVQYFGAEPMFSILNGINVAINAIKLRGTPGDSVGARFFDSTAGLFNVGYPGTANPLMRTFPLTSLLDTSSNNAVAQLLLATDVTNATGSHNPSEQSNRLLFPRRTNGTNLPDALTIAMNTFAAQPDFGNSQGMVIVFTDGRSNCSTALGCNNTFAALQQSLNDSMQIIAQQYVPTRVSVHWFVVGGKTGQHNLLRGSGNNTCMDDEQARADNWPWTDQDYDGPGYELADDYDNQWNQSAGPGTVPYFFFPNQLYDAALLTSGVWEPIRKCCDGSCSGTPTAIDGPCCNGVPAGHLVTSCGALGSNLDAEGRLLCDPLNRSTKQQIEDGIVNIFSKSPYILVE